MKTPTIPGYTSNELTKILKSTQKGTQSPFRISSVYAHQNLP